MPEIPNTDLVCTECRWRAGHSPDCARKDEPWPTITVDEDDLSALLDEAHKRYPASDRWRTADYTIEHVEDRGIRISDMADGWLIARLALAVERFAR